MDTLGDILADAIRSKKEALEIMEKVKTGARLASGMTTDQALEILEQNIADYDRIIERLGWRNNA